jgi:hypothetical protein
MKTLLIFSVSCLLLSCGQKSSTSFKDVPISGKLTQEELKILEEQSNEKEIEDVSFKVQHIPTSVLQKMYSETSKEYDNFSCFYFDVKINGCDDITQYPSIFYSSLNDKVSYLSFQISQTFSITSNKKEYRCINSTFDRTFGKSDKARFFLVFDKIKEDDITFKYSDNYFNQGDIMLKLKI